MSEATSLQPDVRASLRRRLLPFYLAAGLQSCGLWYAIEKPFLAGIGATQSQMSQLVALGNIVLVFVNIPAGLLSDRWSRRNTLMLGGVAMTASSIVGGLSHGLGLYIVSLLCFILFISTYSGGYDALVYDVVIEETGSGQAYAEFYGRTRIVEGVLLAVSSLAGGLLAAVATPATAYFATAPFFLLSIVVLGFFNEPQHHRREAHAEPARLFAALQKLLTVRRTAAVVVTMILVGVANALMTELDQLWMLALDVPIAAYGPINALLLITVALGGWLASNLKISRRNDVYAALLAIVMAIALSIHNIAVVVIAQASFIGLAVLLNISLSQRLHDATATNVRSVVSSAVATAAMVAFVPTALLFGALTQSYGVFKAAWLVAAVALLVLVGVMAAGRQTD